jgi:hypothetical protein
MPVFPSLAQVDFPNRPQPWYIAQARNHQGFVVQQRYRGVGEPTYGRDAYGRLCENFQEVESYLQPFLNPEAVRAAGHSLSAILRWSAAHPGEIFTHPTYAALCLRWDENTQGVSVKEMLTPPLVAEEVPCTPHTCWKTGITFYQLGKMGATAEGLLVQLKERAGLEDHEQERGLEGAWQGWYSTDRARLETVLAAFGKRLVLTQPKIEYGVWVQTEASDQEQLLTSYATAEQAWEHFSEMPAVAGDTSAYPRLTIRHAVYWPGEEPRWWLSEEKYLTYQRHTPSSQATGNRRLPNLGLAEIEWLCPAPVPTLAGVLASTGLTRQLLAADLGWTDGELTSYEQDPARLTLTQLTRIANLTAYPLPRLVALLERELRARELVKQ